MTSTATDLFIFYKAEDRAHVQPLVSTLEAEGFTVWWDVHVGSGTNWRRDIEEHLDAMDAWSSSGANGQWDRKVSSSVMKRGTRRRRGTYRPALAPIFPPVNPAVMFWEQMVAGPNPVVPTTIAGFRGEGQR